MESALETHGLWLLLEALSRLEDLQENANGGQHVEAKRTKQIKCEIDQSGFKRGYLSNKVETLVAFFYAFGSAIKSPLEYYVDRVEKGGKSSNVKIFKALPTSFLRLAAALVIHHR